MANDTPKKMISSIHIAKTHSNSHMAELPERKWWQLLHLNEGRWPADVQDRILAL